MEYETYIIAMNGKHLAFTVNVEKGVMVSGKPVESPKEALVSLVGEVFEQWSADRESDYDVSYIYKIIESILTAGKDV